MRKPIKALWDEKGVALVSIILILLLLLTLGSVLLSISTIEKKISINQKRATQALYLAEAGVNMAMAELKNNPSLLDAAAIGQTFQLVNKPISIGSQGGVIKSVELVKQSENESTIYLVINSVGEINSLPRKISVRVELVQFALEEFNVYSISATGGKIIGDVYIYGPGPHEVSDVEGNVWSGGDVTVRNGTVTGNVYANGSIDTKGSGRIDGQAIENAGLTIEEPPEIDFEWYKSRAEDVYTGDQSFGGNDVLNGIIFVEGNISVSGNPKGQGTLVATGDITITGSSQFEGMLVSGGTFKGDGSSNFSGGIIADNIVLKGSAEIKLSTNSAVIVPPGYGEVSITMLSWKDISI